MGLDMNKPTTSISTLRAAGHSCDMRIGSILADKNKLCDEDIERIALLQLERNIRFGEAARELGLVSEDDVAAALAAQFGMAVARCDESHYPPELVAAFGNDFHPQLQVLREVRTRLMLGFFTGGRKALTIAGVSEAECASMFVANLAVACSQLNKRTLLVDANLRSPMQHAIFRIPLRNGLSDILAGRAEMDALPHIEPFTALSVLPAGTTPPNPEELLGQDCFRALHQMFCNRFDIILYDTPALSDSAATLNIAALTGGIMIIARRDKTAVRALKTTAGRLGANNIPIIGSVLVDD